MKVYPYTLSIRRGVNRKTGVIRYFKYYRAGSYEWFDYCLVHHSWPQPGSDLYVPFIGRLYHGRSWCDPIRRGCAKLWPELQRPYCDTPCFEVMY